MKTFGAHNKPHPQKAALKRRTDPLTDKERLLAQGLVQGLSMKAAYQKAGYSAVALNTDRITERPRFIRHLDELRKRQIERLAYSIDNLCARLEHIAEAAMAKNQFGPAVQAVMGIGKMMGHLADKTEIELHILSKPAREPTDVITLSPEEWQEQFAPKPKLTVVK
jgi:hypothetical protein